MLQSSNIFSSRWKTASIRIGRVFLWLALITGGSILPVVGQITPGDPGNFITTWQTTDNRITIPISGGTYTLYWVNMEDSTDSGILENRVTHTSISDLKNGVNYRVEVSGDALQISINSDFNIRNKIRSIEQWGDIVWITMANAFYGSRNLIYNASDKPDLSEVTNMTRMFSAAQSFDGEIGDWDVSNVENMQELFSGTTSFNGDIGDWDVSNVNNMREMFMGANAFNQDLTNWDVSKVTNMNGMFSHATEFNGNIGTWDVSEVTTMRGMFLSAHSFNQDLTEWDVSNVTDMSIMFLHPYEPGWPSESTFNGDISTWDVSSVTDMSEMFSGASSFNQDLSEWNVSNVVDMSWMFYRAHQFDQDIGKWEVSNVNNMENMFNEASSFNQGMVDWDVSNVSSMNSMFYNAEDFNGDISTWDVSNVTSMDNMFSGASSFNRDISNWNVSKVIGMIGMFERAFLFNQGIGKWDISSVEYMGWMLDHSGLSRQNYDAMLTAWSQLPLQNQVDLGAEGLEYCADDARQTLKDTYGWSINGDRLAEDCGETADPPLVDAANSTVTATEPHIADGVDASTVTMVLVDSEGNPLSGLEDEDFEIYLLSLADKEIDGVVGTVVESQQPGTYTFTVTSLDALTIWPVITIDEVELDDKPEIDFVPPGSMPFITIWKTDIPETPNSTRFKISTHSESTYDYVLYWESIENENHYGFLTGQTGSVTVDTQIPGTYRVAISGVFPRLYSEIYSSNDPYQRKLMSVERWGDIEWSSMENAFWSARNVVINATDAPDLSKVTSMESMFDGAHSLQGDFSHWDVSNVENMRRLFYGSYSNGSQFNGDISGWDVSNVTQMQHMFQYATSFNGDISSWDVGNVEDMSEMFAGAISFNSDLSKWDVKNVRYMPGIFFNAASFNQDISEWDVANVEDMSVIDYSDAGGMFEGASLFDQDIGQWDVSNVLKMGAMLNNSGISRKNYDLILTGWAKQVLQPDVWLDAEGLEYCADDARQTLKDTHGWNINGDSLAEDCGETADPPLVDAANSTVTATTPHIADGVDASTVTMELVDSGGNPLSGLEDEDFEINLLSMADKEIDGVVGTVFESQQPGTYTFTVTSLDALPIWPVITIDEVELDDKPEIDFVPPAPGSRPFITTWKTDIPETPNSTRFTIFTHSESTYNYDLYWESIENENHYGFLAGQTGNVTVNTQIPGTYRVEITGVFPRLYSTVFNTGNPYQLKLMTVEQWGDIEWSSMEYAFTYAANLEINAADAPDLSNVTSMLGMFDGAVSVNSDLNHWDVSGVKNMRSLFRGRNPNGSKFNGNISDWDVSNVETMEGMFFNASSFNGDISGWDVENVENMSRMFYRAKAFNQDIEGWDVSNVEDMVAMFAFAESFNGDISKWDVSSVSDMAGMFFSASSFNQNIGSWVVSNVYSMGDLGDSEVGGMFEDADSFNQDLSRWDVGNVEYMGRMLDNSGLSRQNYDAILSGWSQLQLRHSVWLSSEGLEYCEDTARQAIIDTFDWIINGDSLAEDCGETADPPLVDAANSNVTVTTPHLADSTDFSTVTILLIDTDNNPMIGLTDSDFKIEVSGTAIADSIREASTAGEYFFTVTHTEPDTVTVIVTVGDVVLDDQPVIVFEVPTIVIDGLASSVIATTPHIADGADAATVLVHVLDEDGQTVTGLKGGHFSIALKGDANTSPITETDSTGTYSFEITTTEAGTVHVAVSVLGTVLNDKAEIIFESPARIADGKLSRVTVTSPNLANGTDASVVTVQVLDHQKSPISGLTEAHFVIDLTGQAVASSAEEVKKGVYQFLVTNTLAETVQVTIAVQGVQLSSRPEIVFEAPEQIVDAKKSSVTATTPHISNGTDASIVEIILLDQKDNLIAGLTSESFLVRSERGLVLSETKESDRPGVYRLTAKSKAAGDFRLRITVNGVRLSDEPIIRFEEPLQVVSAELSEVTATSPHLADGEDASTVTILLRDEKNEQIAGMDPDAFHVALSGMGQYTTPVEGEPGQYLLEITSTEAGESRVAITVSGVRLTDAPVIEFEQAPAPVPDPPALLALSGDPSRVQLIWQPADNEFIRGYIVYRGYSPHSMELIGRADRSESSFVDREPSGSSLFYRLSAVNTDGIEGPLSDHLAFFNSRIEADHDAWRLVSSSLLEPVENSENTTLFGFSNQYELAAELQPAQGYWIKSKSISTESLPVTGPGLSKSTISLQRGWNLIGSLSAPVPVNTILDREGILSPAPVFGFSTNGYEAADIMMPNSGYWIHADRSGSIEVQIQAEGQEVQTISHAAKVTENESSEDAVRIEFGNGKQTRKLWISDTPLPGNEELKFLLPPESPEPDLDIRTSESLSLIQSSGETLHLKTEKYPVSASIYGLHADSEYTWRFVMSEGMDEHTMDLIPGSPVVFLKAYDRIELMKIRMDEAITESKLLPSYPNPFNPATTIQYQLREPADMKIEVFDSIGRRVQVLVNGFQASGQHKVHFHASHLSTGMYIVRFVTGGEAHHQKITLIK